MPRIDTPGVASGQGLAKLPLRRLSGITPRLAGWASLAALSLVLFDAALGRCQIRSQIGGVVCRGGDGVLDAEFQNGVRVHVGAARNGDFATHACAAKLSWEKQELLAANGVAELDLDAFGADFGDGVPVAAFQIKKSDLDCCMEYRVYSLEKPSRLLRSIAGGEYFSAADVDLDGNVEIWTNDAAAVSGFEKLTLGELHSPPTIVLRFAHGKLWDASTEFQAYFDREIAGIRAEIPAPDLEEFKHSDGRLEATPTASTAERLHRLRTVKIHVLEVVWAFLYSGREQEAWRALSEMWPPADIERIRDAVSEARQAGMHAQVDGTWSFSPRGKKKNEHIYDAKTDAAANGKWHVVAPQAILLELPPGSDPQSPDEAKSKLLLDLVIDECGKVRSVEPVGNVKVDPDRIRVAFTWKFIPAFSGGRAVASRLRIDVSPKQ
ncbi:MAG: hypothetical protein ABSD75_30945 [Terriglobales bacterium]|jgi:hypothetical protein